jgi:hypothetical protein
MSPKIIIAKRKFYVTKYGQNQKKLKGTLAVDFGPDNSEQDYANWLSLALRNHPKIRYFKIKADFQLAMRSWTNIWVYDRQFQQLRYSQRRWETNVSKISVYRVYQNVDDATIHVLAEDRQPLEKFALYTLRQN